MFPHRARLCSGRPSRRRSLLYASVASVVLVGATSSGTLYVKAQAHDAEGLVSSSVSRGPEASSGATTAMEATVESSAMPTAAASSRTRPSPVVDRDALLAEAVKAVAVEDGAAVSVAVLDVSSGESAVYGDGAFDTASIVKVDILASLLLRAQDAGRGLTAQEKSYAAAMIRNSDNASATALWTAIGQAEGLRAANERFGLRDTEGGDGALWGLTQTTAADQLTLLRQVFGGKSELSESSRAYLTGLMEEIAVGQDWGVSAAASGVGASEFALKNGWLPRSATGLWDINSVGRVSAGGREYLVAVLSDGNSSKEKGVSMVEAVAKAAVSCFDGD
ncbi:class A beta-lactamase-related serine hydrolase [Streptomyces phaeochromogenes]|uniref:serine hydrolase n=1 Tax=Streptomyces phaeochromogenes TaxID=1923 RepID=UPI00224F380C|nr:serine hydrolase [Streptomyces phaeochromogenes]MCX5598160.1 class A beta-lactamase-related serine hydrolase [Streptomyces phaeochromogenes]